MKAISVKLDGTAAAAPTDARKRAALFSALQYAVELELLPHNPTIDCFRDDRPS